MNTSLTPPGDRDKKSMSESWEQVPRANRSMAVKRDKGVEQRRKRKMAVDIWQPKERAAQPDAQGGGHQSWHIYFPQMLVTE
jgi:hypothetical protein